MKQGRSKFYFVSLVDQQREGIKAHFRESSRVNMKQLFILVVCLHACLSVNPGVKLRITKKGVAYANQVAKAEIAEQLKSLKIPDQSGSDGHISYTLTSIQVRGVTPPSSAITLDPHDKGAKWSLSNFGISIHSDWRVKYKEGWFKVSTSGSVDAKIKGVSVVETIGFGIDKTGRPSVVSKGCSDSVGDVDVDFHGGTAFILNLFKSTFERRIKDLLQDRICQEVVTAVNVNAEHELAKMDVNVEIGHRFLLDYALVAAPSITDDYAELFDKGEAFWESDKKECPFSPTPIAPWTDNSNMVYIWLTDYTANSFLYQAHTHGYLKYNVTKNDLPSDQKSYLNTTCKLQCIGTIIPQIRSKYPNSDVEMHIKSRSIPRAIFSPGNLSVSLDADIQLWAHTPNNQKIYMATLDVNVNLTVKADIKDERVTASITGHKLKVSVEKSAIGPINDAALNLVLGGVVDLVVIPQLNALGEKGVVLPITDQVKFLQTKLVLQKGALLIATDVQYKVSAGSKYAKNKSLYFVEEDGAKLSQPNNLFHAA